jgi:hypothetical protein
MTREAPQGTSDSRSHRSRTRAGMLRGEPVRWIAAGLTFVSMLISAPASAQSPVEALVDAQVERLGTESVSAVAEGWKPIEEQRAAALPLVRERLRVESGANPRRNAVLLGLATWLARSGDAGARKEAIQALYTVDLRGTGLDPNVLFRLTHEAARDRDADVLPWIDRIFLSGKRPAFIEEVALQLEPAMQCVFLYGVYGEGAETHLRPFLAVPQTAARTVEILSWIGSPASVPDVAAASTAGDHATLARLIDFMMRTGGPDGRAAVLAIDPARLDADAREAFVRVRPSIEKQGLEQWRASLTHFPGPKQIADEELRARLVVLERDVDSQEAVHPLAILDSGLPRDELIDRLVRIRANMFVHLTDRALTEVDMTNFLINALRYRTK